MGSAGAQGGRWPGARSSGPSVPTFSSHPARFVVQAHRRACALEKHRAGFPGSSPKPWGHLAADWSGFRRHRHTLFRAEAHTIHSFLLEPRRVAGWSELLQAGPVRMQAGWLLTFQKPAWGLKQNAASRATEDIPRFITIFPLEKISLSLIQFLLQPHSSTVTLTSNAHEEVVGNVTFCCWEDRDDRKYWVRIRKPGFLGS